MNTSPAIRCNPRPEAWDTLPRTLTEALLAADPQTPIVYIDQQGRESRSSYGELLASARRVASGCRARGMTPGTRVLLQLVSNEEILPAFWGSLFAGLEPTIVPVPVSYDMHSRQLEQLEHLYELLDFPALITNGRYLQAIRRSPLLTMLHDASMVELAELAQAPDDGLLHAAAPDDVAFFVLSSGSTGLPKAVTLTHDNMVARGRGANSLCGHEQPDVILSWLPFDHIGNISAYHISPILNSSTLVYAPKEYVLARPLRWLDLIDRYRVTHGWAPNFAFGLIVKALQRERGSWDLSSLKGLLSAGELVSYHTVQAFLDATASYGLRRDALISAFGMAEVCSGVNYHLPPDGQGIGFLHLDRRELDRQAVLTTSQDPHSITFANLGPIVPGMAMRIIGETGEVLSDGQIGRFQLKGEALMQGYYRNPEANAAFTDDGWFDTGDAAFIREDDLYLVGRAGLGIVINGANLSNLEVETAVEELDGIEPSFTAACAVFPPDGEQLKLAIFYHPAGGQSDSDVQALPRRIQAQLTRRLGIRADYCIPVDKATIPKTAIGKIQHKQLIKRFQAGEFSDTLAAMEAARSPTSAASDPTGLEGLLANIWRDVLQISEISADDSFFELGGDSLALMQVLERINDAAGTALTLVDLFKYTSVAALAEAIEGSKDRSAMITASQRAATRRARRGESDGRDVAVIGIACRFPGADDPQTFWKNLLEGVESITRFDDDAMARSGFSKGVYDRPEYVKASPMLKDARRFDAEFFGYSRRDAELMDPQQRQFLECAWETFENAGYDPTSYAGAVGVYAGAAMNTYLLNNVLPNRHTLDPNDDMGVTTLDSMGGFMAMVGNDKDYLTTRVSYKLNLSGPSVNVQTACSTGLVCIHMACQSLLAGEADMFLAGCSSIQSPEYAGHLYQPGMIVTSDGHVRSFDARASGTIFGSGVGAVLLKRLDDALADGDHIHAVIKGSAVNNDAGAKVGYMAPSSDGQARAVAEALAVSGVPANSIGLVEAHGTGTVVGDPIEFDGLAQVFREGTDASGFCALGSVKANVGHLQISSGTAGFIKAVLAVQHGMVPPLINFETPNPALALDNGSPFFINAEAVDWPVAGIRRAAVNSLGIGGTNAHAIVEQAPELPPRDLSNDRPAHLLMLTAKSVNALRTLAERYRDHLRARPEQSLGDVCFTANTGRKHFPHRLAIHAGTTVEMAEKLQQYLIVGGGQGGDAALAPASRRPLAMLFTGQGSQYAGMADTLYQVDPVFTASIDRCAQLFEQAMAIDLRVLLTASDIPEVALRQTRIAQPLIFSLDYALARMWQAWGLRPDYLVGHSLGEYVAACLAGIFSLEDAVRLVAARAEAMQALPEHGEMWVVGCDARTARKAISAAGQDVALAADNAPLSVVISGERSAVALVLKVLEEWSIRCHLLATSHAFHSPLMGAAREAFASVAAEVAYSPAEIPLVSNLTGCVASEEMLCADYWCEHMMRTVQFRQSMLELSKLGVETYLEVGPRPTLITLAMQNTSGDCQWLHSLAQDRPAWSTLLDAAAQLATAGRLDLAAFDVPYQRRRVELPTYPFAQTRYWLEPPDAAPVHAAGDSQSLLGRRLPLPALRDRVYENVFDPLRLPVLGDHRIGDRVVVSAAGLVSMLLQLAQDRCGSGRVLTLRDIMFERPLVVDAPDFPRVQTVLHAESERIEIVSMRAASPDSAVTHLSAQLDAVAATPAASLQLEELRRACSQRIEISGYLADIKRRNFSLGSSYRWISTLHVGPSVAVAALRVPGRLGGLDAARIPHPGLLDTCFGLLLVTADLPEASTWLPFAIETIHWAPGKLADAAHAVFALRDTPNDSLVIGDGHILDAQGEVLVEIRGLQARPLNAELLGARSAVSATRCHYENRWLAIDAQGDAASRARWLLVGSACATAPLASLLREMDQDVRVSEWVDNLSEDVDGVISLLAFDDSADPLQVLYRNRALLIQLARAEKSLSRGVWVVSDCGDSASGKGSIKPAQATLQGLCLSVRHEHPELSVRLLDIQSSPTASGLLAALQTREDASLLAIDGDQLYRRELVPFVPAGEENSRPQLAGDRSYLVTGAHGALGSVVTDWLVDAGAEHLLLIGRSAPGAARRDALTTLRERGVCVTTVSCDLADRQQVEKMLGMPELLQYPLAGIFHCAGVLKDGPLIDSSDEDLASVLSGKALGAENLHCLTQDVATLDHFVLFSSAASVLGNAGQTAYAAANAYLDGLAQLRVSMGLAASSINWGPWAGPGMAADGAAGRQLAALGFTPLTQKDALGALAFVLTNRMAQLCVVDCDWNQLAEHAPANRALLGRGLFRGRSVPAREVAGENLSDLEPDQRRALLEDLVPQALASTLGIANVADIPRNQPMSDFGLDSLLSVQLRNRLSIQIDRSLPVGIAFAYPTLNAMVDYLHSMFELPVDDLSEGRAAASGQADAEARSLLDDLDTLLDGIDS